jgi:hypothetical protein
MKFCKVLIENRIAVSFLFSWPTWYSQRPITYAQQLRCQVKT